MLCDMRAPLLPFHNNGLTPTLPTESQFSKPGLYNKLPGYAVQSLLSRSAPLIIGAAPVPYVLNVIGLPDDPEDGMVNCSYQVCPFRKRTESPAEKLFRLISAIVL